MVKGLCFILSFFPLVLGGRIDHGHHLGSAGNALNDTVAFEAAVAKAMEMTNEEDTLVIVTADHSHTMAISGYPSRGNPILGNVAHASLTSPEPRW